MTDKPESEIARIVREHVVRNEATGFWVCRTGSPDALVAALEAHDATVHETVHVAIHRALVERTAERDRALDEIAELAQERDEQNAKAAPTTQPPQPPPRYDEVWAEGVAALNRDGLPPCETCHGSGVHSAEDDIGHDDATNSACSACNGTGTKGGA